MTAHRKKVSTAVGNRRLLKLAALLEADAKNKKGIKFNVDYYMKPADINNPRLDCSTQACAVGLACLSGAFKRDGLSYVIGFNSYELVPAFDSDTDTRATERFFAIEDDDFSHLFLPSSYEVTTGAKAERHVAERIRRFVAERGAAS